MRITLPISGEGIYMINHTKKEIRKVLYEGTPPDTVRGIVDVVKLGVRNFGHYGWTSTDNVDAFRTQDVRITPYIEERGYRWILHSRPRPDRSPPVDFRLGLNVY